LDDLFGALGQITQGLFVDASLFYVLGVPEIPVIAPVAVKYTPLYD
jgi:hypothetical protein